MTPEKLGNKEFSNRDIHGSCWILLERGNRQDLLRKLVVFVGGEGRVEGDGEKGGEEHERTRWPSWMKDRKGEQGKRYLD